MMSIRIEGYAARHVSFVRDIIGLYVRNGWGAEYEVNAVHGAFLRGTTLIAFYGDEQSEAVGGLLRGFTDGQFVAWIGEIVVDPDLKRRGIGTALLDYFLTNCGATAAYLDALGDSKSFFAKRGFVARPSLTAMSMKRVP